CAAESSSRAVRAAAPDQTPDVEIHRDGLVGGRDQPWQVDLEISRQSEAPARSCGPLLYRKVHVANVSPGAKGPFDESWTPTSAVAEPARGDVIVTDAGSVHGSPYAG